MKFRCFQKKNASQKKTPGLETSGRKTRWKNPRSCCTSCATWNTWTTGRWSLGDGRCLLGLGFGMLLETKEMDGNGKVSSESSGKEMSEIWNPMDSAQECSCTTWKVVRPERNNRSVCEEHGVMTTWIPMWECLQSRTPQKSFILVEATVCLSGFHAVPSRHLCFCHQDVHGTQYNATKFVRSGVWMVLNHFGVVNIHGWEDT